jgi:hypothetical protein
MPYTTTTEERQEIAKTILAQLGGNHFRVMTGADKFVALESGLSFSFKGSRVANHCRVTLRGDLYDYEFFKYSPSKGTCTPVKKYEHVYDDMLQPLFKEVTGLNTFLF